MRSIHHVAIVAILLSGACRPNTHSREDGGWQPYDDGGFDDDGQVGLRDTGVDPNCATGAEWVYLVDSDYELIRFEPDSLTLVPLGPLSCPGSGGGSPFSMSVDRNGTAWVLYNGGRIYHVSTVDVSCAATDFTPRQAGFELFGMGFVSDAEGSDEETLYVAGGSQLSIGTGTSSLGYIDERLVVNRVGGLPGWPELTGTGEGELWGFFPDTSPPSVRQIEKASGATPVTFELHQLGAFISAEAWAFAAWGGRFYIFLKRPEDSSTHIWRLDPSDGSVVDVMADIGYRIVGAGVSTCAPYILI